jgi:ADP-heptose:LPS heptosyltransferase
MDAPQTPGEQLKSARYVYRRAAPRFLAAALDAAGPFIFSRKKHASRPADFAHIAVIRVDQIGDIVLAVPFLRALRLRYPKSRITFVTTGAGQALLRDRKDLAEVMVFDAPWFRGDRGVLQAMRDLRLLLKTLAPDAVVDLRGDVRHLWSARRALSHAWIEGYGITGGGFLADHAPAPEAGVHASLKNFAFMDVARPSGLPVLNEPIAAQPLNRRVTDLLPPKTGPWVAFHIGAGADSKRWPETHWKRLAERVSRETAARIIWIGDRDADDRARIILSMLTPEDRLRSTVLCHLAGLGELGTLLEACDLLVSHDSGPAHVAATRSLPTLVLFSGANDPEEWRPLNPRAQLMTHPAACAPCGLKVCSQPSHICMEGISPDTVFERIKERLV